VSMILRRTALAAVLVASTIPAFPSSAAAWGCYGYGYSAYGYGNYGYSSPRYYRYGYSRPYQRYAYVR